MDLRELSNQETEFESWCPFVILKLIVIERPGILQIFNLLNMKMSACHNSIASWYNVLESPVHEIVRSLSYNRHPQHLAPKAVTGMVIGPFL